MSRIFNSSALTNGLVGIFDDPFNAIAKISFFSSDPAEDSNFMDPITVGMMPFDVSTLTGFIDTYISSVGMPTDQVYFTFDGPPGVVQNSDLLLWENTTGSTVTITHILVEPYYFNYSNSYVAIQLDEPRTVISPGGKTVFFPGQIVVSLQNPA